MVYTDAEAITEAVNFTMLDSNDVTFNVNLNGNTVKALYNGDLVIESGSYEVAAEHNLSVSQKSFNLFCIGTDSHKSQIIKYLIF